ncbi:hypothetical protein Esti_002335 [Eimeria stiedai]
MAYWNSVLKRRTVDEARNADCASVHLTFYELPPSAHAQLQNEGTRTKQNDEAPSMSTTVKSRFEKLWGEAARLLQRQPGYNYTLMFRRVTSVESLDDLGAAQPAEAESQSKGTDRSGVAAGLGNSTCEVASSEEEPQSVDYVEMRVWESDNMHQKAQAQQLSFLQKMQELGVLMSVGRYRRVFDDALVRLIQ